MAVGVLDSDLVARGQFHAELALQLSRFHFADGVLVVVEAAFEEQLAQAALGFGAVSP